MRQRFVLRALALALLTCGAFNGCSEKKPDAASTPEVPRPVFTVPEALTALDGEHFFDHPWPSDYRRESDGTVRLDGYINPRNSPLLKTYMAQMKGRLDGFSPVAAGYLAFQASIDEATLPKDAKATEDKSSSVQLVDVDDKSPEVGSRHPMRLIYRDRVGDYYTLPHTLSWMPSLGMPLRPKTRYAIVATRALKTPSGAAFEPNAELQLLLDGKGKLGPTWATAIAQLEKAGVAKTQIAHLSVFTTSDPVGELLKVAEHARTLPPPKVSKIEALASTDAYDNYLGNYDGSPDYQKGEVPFKTEGGEFVFDPSGTPIKQRDFSLRFKLAVPKASKCPPPEKGYPIVLYAHGTGGDYGSFERDKTADALADKCLASMGIDQIFHGTRPGAPPDGPNKVAQISLLFFNVSNSISSRTSTRQAAIDEVARARLVATGGLVVPSDVSKTGVDVKFDPARIAFFGHSQGGLNGPLLFAVDDQTKGGVLSGAGSAISYSLLAKTSPEPSVSGLVKAFLGVSADNEDELTELHPAISLVQTLIDPSDPVHYYGAITRAPFGTHVPKSVLMTEGVFADGSGDTAAPPRTIEAGAIAARYPILNPQVRDIPELTSLAAVAPLNLPVSGNFASGKATSGIAQFEPPAERDGHFVVFDVPRARTMAAAFCASVVTDSVPTLAAP